MNNSKKIFALAALPIIMLITSAFTSFQNGNVIMIIHLEVKNFVEWKKMLDTEIAVQEKKGLKMLSIGSSIENENQIVLIEEVVNAQTAHDLLIILKSKEKENVISNLNTQLYDKGE
jgi:septum formation inhibitor MinC